MDEGEMLLAFINDLINETNEGRIIWKNAEDVRRVNMGTHLSEDAPGAMAAIQPSMIVDVEFAAIDFSRSYYCHIAVGALYFLYHNYAYAKEDSPEFGEGFELRLQTTPYDYDESYEVIVFDAAHMLRLEEAILAQEAGRVTLQSVSTGGAPDRYKNIRRYVEEIINN